MTMITEQVDEKKLASNYRKVVDEIAKACEKSGRKQKDVTLVAVSKRHCLDCVRALAGLGHKDFGESYVQEAMEKMDQAPDLDVRWHFIGGLQSNKAKYVAGNFHLVHSLDSVKLAKELNKKAEALNTVQDVLIQVNLAGEEQKSGISEQELQDFIINVLENKKGLNPKGLMLMPPWDPDPEKTRPYFRQLRELRDRLAGETNLALPELSMGMSNDFIQAIEEGATMVRVGTSIFGERAY